jgi:hypothetical protein
MPRALQGALALALVLMTCAPAHPDEGPPVRRPSQQPRIALPPERHVIEVVQPPGSGNFIINGTRFTAKTAACNSWAAGEPIALLAGDPHGRCVDAVFHNLARRATCEVWCRAWYRW